MNLNSNSWPSSFAFLPFVVLIKDRLVTAMKLLELEQAHH